MFAEYCGYLSKKNIRELLSGFLSLMQSGNAYGYVLRHLFWLRIYIQRVAELMVLSKDKKNLKQET